MRCEEVRLELARDVIAPALREAVNNHITGCPACRGTQALYARMGESLKHNMVWEPPQGFASNIASQVARPSKAAADALPRRPRIEAWDLLCAVILGLLSVATLYMGSGLFVQTTVAAIDLMMVNATRFVWVCAIGSLCVSAWFTRRAFR